MEEPFWFRDEITTTRNTLGRYTQTGTSGTWSHNSTSGWLELNTTSNESKNLIVPQRVSNQVVSVDLYPLSDTSIPSGGIILTTTPTPGATYLSIPGSYAKVRFNQASSEVDLELYRNLANLASVSNTTVTKSFSYGDKFTLTLSDDGTTVTATLYDSLGDRGGIVTWKQI